MSDGEAGPASPGTLSADDPLKLFADAVVEDVRAAEEEVKDTEAAKKEIATAVRTLRPDVNSTTAYVRLLKDAQDLDDEIEIDPGSRRKVMAQARGIANRLIGEGGARPNCAPLTRWTTRYKIIISLFVDGMKPAEIAEIVGCRVAMVNRVLSDPTVEEFLHQQFMMELKTLNTMVPLAVEVLRKGMQHESFKVSLNATALFHKMLQSAHGLAEDGRPRATEEKEQETRDIVDVRKRVVGELRKLLPVVRDMTPQVMPVIEGTAQKV